ncbi:helix-hairpin-helix domain-containing protein [Shewanella sp. AS1]|uniref:ComEA family DNA-binding protein n=1 Tax=Shewanella sp. AS1 TaxID=2907626 RepID=UPI001F26099E|nr:ComEA family DNA-binding protein [Shewanella sp. AS1]MCE9678261.1 helix-hairpin-helix domain-containing protein [Shewanella sp. AS1]
MKKLFTAILVCVLSVVPAIAAEPVTVEKAQTVSQPININTATAEQLAELQGIGEAKAQAIVEYRHVNGNFKSIDDLALVKGIGAKLVEKNRALLTL